MIDIGTSGTDFEVETATYEFFFDSTDRVGTLKRLHSHETSAILSFTPIVNGAALTASAPAETQVDGATAAVSWTAGSLPVNLRFWFADEGLAYSYHIQGQEAVTQFAPGSARGAFCQIHTFGPDLERADISKHISMAVSITSQQARADSFFTLDHGNYAIPPYLLALFNRKDFLAFGLLDIPNAAKALDARVSLGQIELSFDYAGLPQPAAFTSPRVCILLASTRTEILDNYRHLVQPEPPSQSDVPAWCLEPIYTTWGDQVYRKHIEDGHLVSEAGAEQYLSSKLIDCALQKLTSEGLSPGTIVVDEGWSGALGDWQADDTKFGGSLAGFIAAKHAVGLRVVLYFNPFLVAANSDLAATHPDYLVKTAGGQPKTITRSGRAYFLLDWTVSPARSHMLERVSALVSADGLHADGVKIAGVKYLPEASDALADPGFGFGECYLYTVLRDIYHAIKRVDANAPVYLACLNPLFASVFDVVRLGNASEVNHELQVQRAETASWLLPDKPIDTDDWAAYQKVVGTPTFVKAVAGVPNIFSAFFRGDGRLRVQGALGGAPVKMSAELYHILSAAWTVYGFGKAVRRAALQIDFDRGEFSTCARASSGVVRTYQGGNVLAVYAGPNVYIAALQNSTVVIDLPKDVAPIALERFDRQGRCETVAFSPCLANKILFDALSSRDETLYYHLKGAR